MGGKSSKKKQVSPQCAANAPIATAPITPVAVIDTDKRIPSSSVDNKQYIQQKQQQIQKESSIPTSVKPFAEAETFNVNTPTNDDKITLDNANTVAYVEEQVSSQNDGIIDVLDMNEQDTIQTVDSFVLPGQAIDVDDIERNSNSDSAKLDDSVSETSDHEQEQDVIKGVELSCSNDDEEIEGTSQEEVLNKEMEEIVAEEAPSETVTNDQIEDGIVNEVQDDKQKTSFSTENLGNVEEDSLHGTSSDEECKAIVQVAPNEVEEEVAEEASTNDGEIKGTSQEEVLNKEMEEIVAEETLIEKENELVEQVLNEEIEQAVAKEAPSETVTNDQIEDGIVNEVQDDKQKSAFSTENLGKENIQEKPIDPKKNVIKEPIAKRTVQKGPQKIVQKANSVSSIDKLRNGSRTKLSTVTSKVSPSKRKVAEKSVSMSSINVKVSAAAGGAAIISEELHEEPVAQEPAIAPTDVPIMMPLKPRCVRVFICSNMDDTATERNNIASNLLPLMQARLMERNVLLCVHDFREKIIEHSDVLRLALSTLEISDYFICILGESYGVQRLSLSEYDQIAFSLGFKKAVQTGYKWLEEDNLRDRSIVDILTTAAIKRRPAMIRRSFFFVRQDMLFARNMESHRHTDATEEEINSWSLQSAFIASIRDAASTSNSNSTTRGSPSWRGEPVEIRVNTFSSLRSLQMVMRQDLNMAFDEDTPCSTVAEKPPPLPKNTKAIKEPPKPGGNTVVSTTTSEDHVVEGAGLCLQDRVVKANSWPQDIAVDSRIAFGAYPGSNNHRMITARVFQYIHNTVSESISISLNELLTAQLGAVGPPPFMLEGDEGVGKLSLLSYFFRLSKIKKQKMRHILCIVGAGDGDSGAESHTLRWLLKQIFYNIKSLCKINMKVPATEPGLIQAFSQWLSAAAAAVDPLPLVIGIGNLHLLTPQAQNLFWLDDCSFPTSLRIVCTATSGSAVVRAAKAHQWTVVKMEAVPANGSEWRDIRRVMVLARLSLLPRVVRQSEGTSEAIPAMSNGSSLIFDHSTTRLAVFRNENIINRLVNDYRCTNPLFLATIVDELGRCLADQRIDNVLETLLRSNDLNDLVRSVYRRIQTRVDRQKEGLLAQSLVYLLASNGGLTDADFRELLDISDFLWSLLLSELRGIVLFDGFNIVFANACFARGARSFFCRNDELKDAHERLITYYESILDPPSLLQSLPICENFYDFTDHSKASVPALKRISGTNLMFQLLSTGNLDKIKYLLCEPGSFLMYAAIDMDRVADLWTTLLCKGEDLSPGVCYSEYVGALAAPYVKVAPVLVKQKLKKKKKKKKKKKRKHHKSSSDISDSNQSLTDVQDDVDELLKNSHEQNDRDDSPAYIRPVKIKEEEKEDIFLTKDDIESGEALPQDIAEKGIDSTDIIEVNGTDDVVEEVTPLTPDNVVVDVEEKKDNSRELDNNTSVPILSLSELCRYAIAAAVVCERVHDIRSAVDILHMVEPWCHEDQALESVLSNMLLMKGRLRVERKAQLNLAIAELTHADKLFLSKGDVNADSHSLCQMHLGHAKLLNNHLDEAEKHLTEALASWRGAGDVDSLPMASTCMLLMEVLLAHGSSHFYKDAELNCKRALSIRTSILGPITPLVAETILALGKLFFMWLGPQPGKPHILRALGIYAQAEGCGQTNVACCLVALGEIANQKHDWASSVRIFGHALSLLYKLKTEAVESSKNRASKDAALVKLAQIEVAMASGERGLGIANVNLGNLASGISSLKSALWTFQSRCGKASNEATSTLILLAETLRKSSKNEDAIIRCLLCLDLRTRRFGTEHVMVAPVYRLLGDLHKDLNHTLESSEFYRLAELAYVTKSKT